MKGGERFHAGLMEGMEMMELLRENGIHSYWPEMGDKTPDGCVFEAQMSYYGASHWHLRSLTGQTLKGRGIKDDGNGWYTVTALAFEKIKKEYPIRKEHLLD